MTKDATMTSSVRTGLSSCQVSACRTKSHYSRFEYPLFPRSRVIIENLVDKRQSGARQQGQMSGGSSEPTSGSIHWRPVCILRERSCTQSTRYVRSRLRRSRCCNGVSFSYRREYRFKPSSIAIRQACPIRSRYKRESSSAR